MHQHQRIRQFFDGPLDDQPVIHDGSRNAPLADPHPVDHPVRSIEINRPELFVRQRAELRLEHRDDILIGTHRIDLLSLFDPKPAPQFQRGGNRGGPADTEPSHHAQGRQIATFHPGEASAEVRQQPFRQPDGRIPGIAIPKQNAQQFGIRQRRRSLRNQFFAHLFVRNR